MTTIPQTAQDAIERVIQEDEGGWKFTDRADDAGGPTYGGMTWKTFNGWQDKQLPSGYGWTKSQFIEDARLNVVHLQRHIYRCYYDVFYLDCHIGDCPEFIQAAFLSMCINAGKKEATKCLQMAVNHVFENWPFATAAPLVALIVDGHWGPRTHLAVNSSYVKQSGTGFKLAFSDAAMERYIRIAQQNARAWRDTAKEAKRAQNQNFVPHDIRLPRVLQSENLMGWFNRAKKYRSM